MFEEERKNVCVRQIFVPCVKSGSWRVWDLVLVFVLTQTRMEFAIHTAHFLNFVLTLSSKVYSII